MSLILSLAKLESEKCTDVRGAHGCFDYNEKPQAMFWCYNGKKKSYSAYILYLALYSYDYVLLSNQLSFYLFVAQVKFQDK